MSRFRLFDAATAIGLVVLTAICLWAAYALYARQAASGSPAAAEASEASAQPRVETAKLVEGPLEVEFTRRGTLQPSGEVAVYPEVTGRVVKKHADVGDTVEKGGVLFELDGTLLQIRLSEAQSRLKSAQSRLQEAESQVAGAEKGEDEDLKRDAKLRRDAAEAAVKVAESQVAEAQKAYDSRIIHAPLAGILSQRLVQEGEFAAPAQPVARIIVVDPIVAVVPLTAEEASGLWDEVECRVMLRGTESSTMPARLVRIAPVADPRTKRISVEVETDNPDRRLRAGMPVDVTFRCKYTGPVVLLPRRALTRRGEALVSFRIERASDGYVARRVEPVLAAIPGRPDSLRVLKGLSGGDTVAIDGLMSVEDGAAVQLASAPDRSDGP